MASFCCKPCEYLGKCIDKGCACGCKACDALCSKPCELLGQFFCPVDKPSPIFLTFSIVICGIPSVAAVLGMASGATCEGTFMVYLGGMIVVNLAMIGFAWYFYNQFSKPYTGQDEGGRQETGVWSRACNMFCYDPVVFVYLVTLLAGFVLSILGATWNNKCTGPGAPGAHGNASFVGGMFWFYLFGGVVVISLSLCVECGRTNGVTVQQQAPIQRRPNLMQRLFFPRANMPSAGAAPYAGNVPYAQPAAPAYVNPPPTNNTQLPQAQPAAWQPNAAPAPAAASLPQGGSSGQYPQQQQQAPAAAATAAKMAAQGLRFGANMLEKATAKK